EHPAAEQILEVGEIERRPVTARLWRVTRSWRLSRNLGGLTRGWRLMRGWRLTRRFGGLSCCRYRPCALGGGPLANRRLHGPPRPSWRGHRRLHP
ncbi:MAG: hypothetical protein WKF49_06990, partial [Thermoleophilaceae bacterium]